MATITSVTSDNWSSDSTWDSGTVPADGDTVVIDSSNVVTFDVDQSGFSTGIDLTINGTLQASETAGTYYLMCSANISGTGELKAGTSESSPYPSNCKFTIDLNDNGVFGSSLDVKLYCHEPSIRWTRLSSDVSSGATNLPVNDDVSSEWNAGDEIYICKHNNKISYWFSSNAEKLIIQSVSSSAITTTSGTSRAYDAGAFIAVANRNIHILNITDDALINKTGAEVYARITIPATDGDRLINSKDDLILGGFIEHYGSQQYLIYGVKRLIYKSVAISYNPSKYFTYYCDKIIYRNSMNMCWSRCGYVSKLIEVDNAYLVSCYAGQTFGYIYGRDLYCYGIQSSPFDKMEFVKIIGGEYRHGLYTLNNCIGQFSNFSFAENISCLGAYGAIPILNNCVTSGVSTEISDYNFVCRHSPDYFAVSYSHNQVAGAVKAWTLGGIVLKTTSVKAPGMNSSYQLSPENNADGNNYWCFWEEEQIVQPGQAIQVKIYYKNGSGITDAQSHIVDSFTDPLVDNTVSALYSVSFDIVYSGWQVKELYYKNNDNTVKNIKIRAMAKGNGTCYYGLKTVIIQGKLAQNRGEFTRNRRLWLHGISIWD